MWVRNIYSIGDLHNDDYFLSFDEDNNQIAKFIDVDFLTSYSIDLDECIRRLEAERSIIEKYGTRLIGAKTWEDVI